MSDSNDQHDQSRQSLLRTGEQRVAAWIGGIVGIVVAINNVYLLAAGLNGGPFGNVTFGLAIIGIPIAVVALLVCGALARRYRLFLAMVGCAVLVSPVIGIAINDLSP
jgi:uncharacterized membrane protein